MNDKGFTLIEVLAVLVILSLIMGIALPAVSNSLEKSKSNQKKVEEKRVVNAAEMFASDYKFEFKSNNCYITINKLVEKGYVSTDLEGYVLYKDGVFEYNDTLVGINCLEEDKDEG